MNVTRAFSASVNFWRSMRLSPNCAMRPRFHQTHSTIAEAIYLGSGSKYEVRLKDGTVAVVRSPLGAADFALGDAVDVAFSPADLILLPDDASADVTLT